MAAELGKIVVLRTGFLQILGKDAACVHVASSLKAVGRPGDGILLDCPIVAGLRGWRVHWARPEQVRGATRNRVSRVWSRVGPALRVQV